MPRKSHYDPSKVHGNFGPGGFSDQYDNGRFRSLDDGQNPGGVTGVHLEDDMELDEQNFSPEKGESYLGRNSELMEPDRDADLSMGEAGTNWNSNIGKGPKGWKLSDAKLRERVSEVLLHSHDVDPSHLEVVVEDSVVYLRGEIKSKGMRTVAEDLVGSIPGVEDVFSELKILEDSESYKLSPKAYNEARRTDES